MRRLLFPFLVLILLASASCGSDNPSGGGSGLDFMTPAAATFPVMPASSRDQATARSPANVSWTWGDRLFETYVILATTAAATSWGTNNVYNNINTAQGYTSHLQVTDTLGRTITSPISWNGGTEVSYESGDHDTSSRLNWIAWTNSGATMRALIASQDDNTTGGEKLEQLVMQGDYNSTTQDLSLKVACMADYSVSYYHGSNAGRYSMRMDASGNAGTHAFTLKVIKTNSPNGYYNITFVGKGISQGAGNYFLFAMKEMNTGGAWGSIYYVCFPASATLAQIQALSPTTNVTDASLANCAAYKADVQAMTFLDTTDVLGSGVAMALW
jgi:hypothetical protein